MWLLCPLRVSLKAHCGACATVPVLLPGDLTKCLYWGNFFCVSCRVTLLSTYWSFFLVLQQKFKSKTVQACQACSKGLDRLRVDSKDTKVLEAKYLDLFFFEYVFSIWKVWQNNKLTIITTKLMYTFDLNSVPAFSSLVSLRKFSNVQIYNTLKQLYKD